MNHLIKLSFVLLLITNLVRPAFAQTDFDRIVFFGDSLSDIGNLHQSTLRLQPGSRYFDGRFSNGPVFTELFADTMGIDNLRPSEQGGDNFAYGGARTEGSPFLEGLFINDLDEQVDEFLDERDTSPNELYVVLAGGNDFVLGNESNPAAAAQRVARQIRRLVDAGARNLLSINLPPLGNTPRFRAQPDSMNERTRVFNTELKTNIDALQDLQPNLSLYQLDIAGLFGYLLEVPSAFAMSNVTDPGIDADNAVGYVFWDGIHPTTAAHSVLARAAFRLFDETPLIGDFNLSQALDVGDVDLLAFAIGEQSTDEVANQFDLNNNSTLDLQDLEFLLSDIGTQNGDTDLNGSVDFPDFLRLSRNFGNEGIWSDGDHNADGSISFPDFLILARNFNSEPTASKTLQQAVVPEPRGSSLPLLSYVAIYCRRRRSSN